MRLLPTTVRTRLTLWYSVVLAVPLIGFTMAAYFIFAASVHARTDAFLTDAVNVVVRELGAERRASDDAEEAIGRALRELHFQEIDIEVFDAEGRPLGRSTPFGQEPAADSILTLGTAVPLPEGETLTTVRYKQTAFRVLQRSIDVGGEAFVLAGIQPLRVEAGTLRRIRRLFFLLVPLILAGAAAGGSFLVGRSLRPVAEMAARAGEIGASTLHARLPVGAPDELGALATVLNGLLERLEGSFVQQQRFMTDASHELRTPTAIIRTEAEVTLARPARGEEEYRASMEVVRESSRRLTRIVEDLFLLARADADQMVVHPEAVYLDDIVRDTVRAATAIADARGVTIALAELDEVPMVADPALLGRVILNLLDNAIKHTPDGGTIEVSLLTDEHACHLTVVDPGPGIPRESQSRVFERFYRVDTARSRQADTLTSGAGLGLAICERIAALHGGAVTLVGSTPGHTEFRVRLPLPQAGATSFPRTG